MKKHIIIAIALLGAGLVATSCSKKSEEKSDVATTENVAPTVEGDSVANTTESAATSADLTALFQENIGKNARESGMFGNEALKSQLTKLLGAERVAQMESNWQTQVPVQMIDGNYVTGGMKDNSGSNPGFTIVYNPAKKNLSVAWVNNGKTEIYQQQPEDITSLIQFPAN